MLAHLDPTSLLGLLAVVLVLAKALGTLAQRAGQPAVLGELLAGVALGPSMLGLVDPDSKVLKAFAEIGVILLLFEIGLETDLVRLLRAGGTASVVAAVGVMLPFVLGYLLGRALGFDPRVALVVGASLTATSVGITGRVLSDLGALHQPEGRVILGAAVLDDVIGLVILTFVAGLAAGERVTGLAVLRTVCLAFGFLASALVIGRLLASRLLRLLERAQVRGALPFAGIILALGLAWVAARCGSAAIMGAFVAGLIMAGSSRVHEVAAGALPLARFFTPFFFTAVGAAVDLRCFDPLTPAGRRALCVGATLLVVAVIGKFVAGYAPFWFRGRKDLVGIGMIPRGEVGIIFAQLGLATGVFERPLFSAVMLMVFVTTMMTPPLLKRLVRRIPFPPPAGEG